MQWITFSKYDIKGRIDLNIWTDVYQTGTNKQTKKKTT